MDIKSIIEDYHKIQSIPQETIRFISEGNNNIRIELVNYFRTYKNRDFALAFLEKCIELRKSDDSLPGNDLMLAGYILGMHNYVEDSIKIWNAKSTDFDSFCYVDIQLTVFAGVEETIAFLKNSNDIDSVEALKYIIECRDYGDLDTIEAYFAQERPWFA